MYVYISTDPTHNPPNYCDHIFATEGLLAKFAKIKTAQKFVVIRYNYSKRTEFIICTKSVARALGTGKGRARAKAGQGLGYGLPCLCPCPTLACAQRARYRFRA